MGKPTILIKDEVNCQLVNFSPEIVSYFKSKFEFNVPSARFSPTFQLGIWDGKISFCNNTGETYVYLLPQIIPDIVELRIKFDIVDNRIKTELNLDPITAKHFEHVLHPDTNEPLILRDYQVEAVNTMLKFNSGLMIASTGSGKTNMTAALCSVYNLASLKALVIVPSVSLVNQTWETLHNCGLDVGRMGGGIKDPIHDTVVSTWQTLQNMKSFVLEFEMLIVDECHGASGNVIKSLISEQGRNIKYRYGLTGTMPKDLIDVMNINNVLGDIKYKITARTLIDAGYLAELHIHIQQLEEDFQEQYNNYKTHNSNTKISYNGFKSKYFPDYTSEKSYLKTNPIRMEYITDQLIDKAKGGNVFGIIDGIAFGNAMLKMIKSKVDNEHIYFISGKDKVKNRQIVYDLFKSRDDVIVFATAQVASVGLDIPRINCLFLIDLGKSFIRTIQSIGRGLRRAPGKDYVEVVDICSDLKYSKRHLSERIKFYKEAEYPHSKKKICLKSPSV